MGGGRKKPELREDTDGGLYTKRQFYEFYGSHAQWDQAPRQGGGQHAERDAALPFVPTGGRSDEEEDQPYGEDFEGAWVPPRLRDKPRGLIHNVNDWHFPMLNDIPRNEFYRDALKAVITAESCVLEIGAGTGLLSMIAASLGAKQVVAIEANQQLVQLGRQIIELNGYKGKIKVIHKMSNEVTADELKRCFGGQLPDILMSELLGTLLLSESAVHYVADAVRRLCRPGATVIPRTGKQFVTLAESQDMVTLSSVHKWGGFDLSPFNRLQDTPKLVYSKMLGARFSTLESTWLSDPIEVINVDFAKDDPGPHLFPGERRLAFQAKKSGTIHCVVASWEVAAPGTKPMSTHPDATRDNFARDMQWGQGVQLVEEGEAELPKKFVVEEGEWLDLVVRCSKCGVYMQFQVERRRGPPPPLASPPDQAQ